ncbi:MAG: excinuclease ABC subunit UvrA [Bacteroidetes bacterium]|nr:excinuclease ABC subunit UvrA [Bacteroidota bacterium]
MAYNKIVIKDASENNLKSVSLELPKNRLILVTGVSGSGKSSLAFDIINKEGQRRYLESFSSYARQFLGKLKRPDVGFMEGLSPAIAVDQRTILRNPRSTVGTLSELHDYLRLLFARLGTYPDGCFGKPIERRLFSFNTMYGACPECKGLGLQDRIDPELLIADPERTLREGALVITTPSGYIIYSQVTMDVLNRVCNAHGFNVDIRWKDLTPEQKDIVLNGSDIISIPYGKHPLESRLRWTGITARPREESYYKGILPVMEDILKRDRNKNILRFARTMTCAACEGKRLSKEALAVEFRGMNINRFSEMTIGELTKYFEKIQFTAGEKEIGEPVRVAVLRRTSVLNDMGLPYLKLNRSSESLSGGEAQRIRLANQAGTGLRGCIYVLDEPSVGLHYYDNDKLLKILKILRDNGNTVIVVEHNGHTIKRADWLTDIGPGAGLNGGEILYNGPLQDFLKSNNVNKSLTHAFMTAKEMIIPPGTRRKGNGILKIYGASQFNLKNIDVEFHLGAFNVVTGVSGAGKSTLVKRTLSAAVKKYLKAGNEKPGKHTGIEGLEKINKIIEIDQAPIGRTPRSNPATYTKLFDHIRDLFASLPGSGKRGWHKDRFSFNLRSGRCESCRGAGQIQVGMHFLGNVDVLCTDCNGKRFNEDTLEIEYKGKNIYEVLEMPVEEAAEFFAGEPKIGHFLDVMAGLGLDYIRLGQSSTTLSGGEAQRIKLASELVRPSTGHTLYILDEPTIGLHPSDVKVLLKSLNELVDKGNTIVSIEHDPDFIMNADRVIDLGPGCGENGGELVFIGTPDELSGCKKSFTSLALQKGDMPEEKAENFPEASFVIDLPVIFKGVTTHNLKNIDVEIPVNKLTVVTGVSGSGKSSLAFDTVFSEGQARFTESLSAYTRTFISKGEKACFEECTGIMPAIAVSRKAAAANPRSTVGTVTEIYDYYRLLYARAGTAYCPECNHPVEKGKCSSCGYTGHHPLYAGMFSFNHEQGACPGCKGLGVITVCDPDKLVSNRELSLLNGAMDGHKSGKYYGDPYGRYTAILARVGEIFGIDFSIPYSELDKQAADIAMYGTGSKEYTVTWKFKRKNREGAHRMNAVWEGFVNYVNEEYERKHADKRGDGMLPLMKGVPCPGCNGARLKPEFLNVRFRGMNIAELSAMTADESLVFFSNLKNETDFRNTPFSGELADQVIKRLRFLQNMGLGYLSIDRKSPTLSGGEAQRIRLAGQVAAGLCGILFVLDEPTVGLHSKDTRRLISVLHELRDRGNTVVVVEHDREMIESADHIIDLGPGAGVYGGRVVAQGTVQQIMKNSNSLTGKYLSGELTFPPKTETKVSDTFISIRGAYANNLKNIDLEIPMGGMVAITGVSGSGKSSLMFDVLAASAASGSPIGCKEITGLDHFSALKPVDQGVVGSTPLSTPSTYTGIFERIRTLFASTEHAKNRGYGKNYFSYNAKGGRCEACSGMGRNKISMDFLPDVWIECEECNGSRYGREALECLYKGKSIASVLDMDVCEAMDLFREDKILAGSLKILNDLGLGYLKLGQAADTLAGGEAQRLKLAKELLGPVRGKNLYLFDEPTTGLHFEDNRRLIQLFRDLVNKGHSIIFIEHNTDLINYADWIIELGPEGGDKGGEVVAEGKNKSV